MSSPASQPESYLTEALEESGLTVGTLVVETYAPATFGNLIAWADTNIGTLRITYDRQFYVERQPPLDTDVVAYLISLLDRYKRESSS